MTMKFLPDVNLHGEMENLQKIEISHLVCKLWVSKVQKRSNSSFLEMSYLSVFELCRPIIYRPDELFQNYLQILHLLMELDIW